MSASSTYPPFDDEDADVVVRSSDGVDFRLYKVILAKASPVFGGMFSLPDDLEPHVAPQIVPVTETAKTLESLLRLCYPVDRSPCEDLDHFVALMEAARKYEILTVQTRLSQDLKALLDKGADPLRAYAIAYLYQIHDLINVSARLLLGNPRYLEPSSMYPEFSNLPAAAVFALITYRRNCVNAATAQVDDLAWMVHGDHPKKMCYYPGRISKPILGNSWAWIACREPDDASIIHKAGYLQLAMKHWISTYLEDAKRALEDHPKGEVVTRSVILVRAMDEASACAHCTKAWKDLMEYSHLLSGRIDEAVSLVRVEVPF